MNSEHLRRLTSIDMPPEALREVLRVFADIQQAEEDRKAKDRARKKSVRGNSTETPRKIQEVSAEIPTDPPSLLPSPTPPTNNSSPDPSLRSGSVSARERREIDREFEELFWPEWPNKASKQAAKKAYPRARGEADLARILEGVRLYRTNKPADRDWMHAATFLNGKRWNDEYSQPPARAGPRSTSNGFSEVLDELRGASVKPTNDPPDLWSATGRTPDRSSAERVPQPAGGSSRGDYLDLRPRRANTG